MEFLMNDELEELRDILMTSGAISCTQEYYEPVRLRGKDIYHICHGYRVEVDYDKLARAIYYAGYSRKEKNNESIT